MNSSTWRCRAVRSVMVVPSGLRSLFGGLRPHRSAGSAGTRTPSEAPTGTVTRSGVRGKHLFVFALTGNTRSWFDANRRSAHRVDLPGWAEPRRGAVPLPGAVVGGLSSNGVTVTPPWFATGDNGRREKEARHMAAVMTTP